ncbi:MAG TPA: ribonucleoside-diphosphate reductase subunit alpha [Aquella sp.]|nr:ribonucleoside-diphosphate reductase subunit alpha [Aquella sp.]
MAYEWLNDDSRTFLSRGYIDPNITAEERIEEIANTAQKYLNIDGFADTFIDYMSRGWYSLASPIWSNFGKERALPISCNCSYIEDNIAGILSSLSEIAMMTKCGAGTAAYFGDIRPRGTEISAGGTTNGAVHFMQMFESVIETISQSNIRRGSFAAYYPVEGGDILEFLDIKEEGNAIQNISIGVTITDKWMEEMEAGDKAKRKIWMRIIKKRFESGYPYIFWTDTVNKNAPQVYKDKGLRIHSSNLCAEVAISTDKEESFVCDLSSMNLLHYDDWKDTNAVEILTYFLDAVMTEYIEKTESIPYMEKARRFAINQRAIGIGGLGWHSYLQSKMIPFESMEAKLLNTQIWKLIDNKTLEASKEMAVRYGEPPLLEGYGERNVTRIAIAPTTSSSFILGQVSPSIEPLNSNYFVKELAKGRFTYKNPYLKEILKTYKKDNAETWKDISGHGGSVQHLEFLSDLEKQVFKTFGEISQKEIIIQAAARQRYIDQSQSINLMIGADAKPKEVNELMLFAWKQGIKTLYYQRGANPAQELSRSILNCVSCEA